ncbi:MAG: FkbM family methyltransferase [Imperialibacter sp.]|uniref:FkbM family methyltransferase n=1 Tax=Imperialibacter sp. TaxID=2038411 RepID=UPI0032EEEE4E
MKNFLLRIRLLYHQANRYFNLLLRYCFQFNRFSFSQLGEDRMLDYIFSFKGIKKPFYIDIGAYHPWNLSNTALFYTQGASGITIEPNEVNHKLFEKYRSRDTNLNIGISDSRDKLNYYKYNIAVFNTFSPEEVENYKASESLVLQEVKEIEVWPLKEVVEKYAADKQVDLLSIDVEGLDLKILKSIDFQKFRPLVICIETVAHDPEKDEQNDDIRTLLLSSGYLLFGSTYFNDIFVATEFWKAE